MRQKILIADDDPDIVKMLRDRLEFEGFETIVASEGVRVIELAHKQKPDLILLDLKMPAGTGQTVLQALRTKSDTKNIPVIVLTALADPGLESEVTQRGAQGFIRKPFDLEGLLSKIGSVFSGSAS